MPFRGVNLWPAALPGFRDATLAWFGAAWALGRLLHRGFALDLGLREDFFEDKLDRPLATQRLLRYPAGPPDRRTRRLAPARTRTMAM
jgi:isopenicillin N synthase-like dioxygenase